MKIYGEYLVVVLLLATLFVLYIKRYAFQPVMYLGISASIILTIVSELAFTIYATADDIANMLGHIFKLYSYWFIYVSIVKTTLTDQFSLMSQGSRTFDAIPDSVVIVDAGGYIRSANNVTTEFTSEVVENIIGEHVHPRFHDNNLSENECKLCIAIKNESHYSTELCKLEFNKEKWVDITLSPTYEISQLPGMIQITRDITKRKEIETSLFETEKAISERNELLNSIISNMQDLIFRTDMDGIVQWVSRVPTERIGYTAEDILQKNISKLYKNSGDREGFLASLYANEGKVSNYEIEMITKSGSSIWSSVNARLIYDSDGNAQGIEGSVRDVTPLKKSEIELLAYKDRLQELVKEQTCDLVSAKDQAQMAERAMSTFLTNMSHELRTPLHGILSFANFGIKKIDIATKEKLHSYFSRIEQSGQQLLRLLNDLLDLSKLRAGKMNYDYKKFEIQNIISKVVLEFSSLVEEKNIEIVVDNKYKELIINADHNKILQVLRNLISNAWKFSPENKKIYITVKVKNSHVELIVEDEGMGIPDAEMKTIFNAFEQSSKTASNAGGTGLGLSICKEIIESGHSGSIKAENIKPTGARFVISMPIDNVAV